MSRLPIRLRLTAVFAAAMVVVLAATAAFVYARLRADLDEAVNASLEARGGFPGDPEESFAQVLAADGRVTAGAPRESALTPRQARVAAREPLLVERKVSGPRATCVSWRVRGPATRAPSWWSGSRWTIATRCSPG